MVTILERSCSFHSDVVDERFICIFSHLLVTFKLVISHLSFWDGNQVGLCSSYMYPGSGLCFLPTSSYCTALPWR